MLALMNCMREGVMRTASFAPWNCTSAVPVDSSTRSTRPGVPAGTGENKTKLLFDIIKQQNADALWRATSSGADADVIRPTHAAKLPTMPDTEYGALFAHFQAKIDEEANAKRGKKVGVKTDAISDTEDDSDDEGGALFS
eukprot:gene9814-5175_t